MINKINSLSDLTRYVISNSVNIDGESKFHIGEEVYVVSPVIDLTQPYLPVIRSKSLTLKRVDKVSLYKNMYNGELYFIYSVEGNNELLLECQLFKHLEPADYLNEAIVSLGFMGYRCIENLVSRIKVFSNCEFERRII